MNCLLNSCSNECVECNWDKWYYGRCNGCGNCFNKDDWIHQRYRFEEEQPNIDYQDIIMYFINDGFQHEGNGVCYECANEEFSINNIKKKEN
jgi:hypothetical protein